MKLNVHLSSQDFELFCKPAFWQQEQLGEMHLLINPRLPDRQKEELTCQAQSISSKIAEVFGQGALLLASSGTRSGKLVALSLENFKVAAEAVNQMLSVRGHEDPKPDHWLCSLPLFHVSGLSICARSALSSSPVTFAPEGWSAQDFCSKLLETRATLSSLVPTQLHDLVQARLVAPADSALRALLIGGAKASRELLKEALALSWPIRVCYGMSETAALFAIAPSSDPMGEMGLDLLPHAQVKSDSADKVLKIKSQALFMGHSLRQQDFKPTQVDADGYWESSDIAEWDPLMQRLNLFGRKDDMIKILGEQVHIGRLEERWSQECLKLPLSAGPTELLIEVRKNPRRGAELVLHLSVDSLLPLEGLINWAQKSNASLPPFERVCELAISQENFPKNTMGKVLLSALSPLKRIPV